MQKVRHPSSLFMVSFDIESLLTNIPLAETINLAVDAIFKSNPNLKISKKDLKTLFEFATKGIHFSFDGDLYDQIDGVAMGSPLAPALANLFRVTMKQSGHKMKKQVMFCIIKDMLMIFFVFLKQKSKLKNFIVSLIVKS